MSRTEVRNEVPQPSSASLPQAIAEEIRRCVPDAQQDDVMNLVAWLIEATSDPVLLDQTIDILRSVVQAVPAVRVLVWRYLPEETKGSIREAMKSCDTIVPFSKRCGDYVCIARTVTIAYETGDEALCAAIDLLKSVSVIRPEIRHRVWNQLHPDVQVRIRETQRQRTQAVNAL